MRWLGESGQVVLVGGGTKSLLFQPNGPQLSALFGCVGARGLRFGAENEVCWIRLGERMGMGSSTSAMQGTWPGARPEPEAFLTPIPLLPLAHRPSAPPLHYSITPFPSRFPATFPAAFLCMVWRPVASRESGAAETKYGSLTRGVLAARAHAPKSPTPAPLFRTLRGGLGQLVDAVEASIRGNVSVRHTRAETVERTGARFRVRLDGDWLEADRLVVACEAHCGAALLGPVDARLAELMGKVAYSSSMTVAVCWEQQ